MRAIYSDNGDDDRAADPRAVPGRRPDAGGPGDVRPVMLEVDGEMFALRPNAFGGTDYAWLSGPDPGYGFGVGTTSDVPLDRHRENIREFLAMVDATTGHLEDDG